MNRYLDIAPEVKEALDAGKPVVALESTIISHGGRSPSDHRHHRRPPEGGLDP